MAQSSDRKTEPEKPSSTRPPKSPKRLQISLPFSVGSFSAVPSADRLLTSVLSGGPVFLCVLDAQSNIAFIDGECLKDLGLASGSLVGHSFFELFPDTQEVRTQLAQAYTGTIVRTTHRLRERPFRVAFLPILNQDESVTGLIVVATDLTGPEGEKAVAPKGHSSAAAKDWTRQVAHELRTPLNSVLGFADLLLRSKEATLNEQDRFYLERIIGNTNYLLQVIGQVLDLSRHAAGKLAPASVNEDMKLLIEETLGELKGLTLSGSVAIFSNVPEGTRPLKTDRIMLKQILINLISNALKYTRRGSITINVHNDSRHRPIRVDVVDTGEGIPKDRMQALFEAFERGMHNEDRMIEGVGLGLAIAQAFCTMLGYTITVSSEVGKGSTFSILLVQSPT